jgi:predicted ATPase with chaperone activity
LELIATDDTPKIDNINSIWFLTDPSATIMADESFRPSEPISIEDTGLPVSLIESLIIKRLAVVGVSSGRQLANDICLSFTALESLYQHLRARQMIVHKGSAPLNDYVYALTDTGRDRALVYNQTCSYVGPAPVPLMDYVLSAEAQTIRAESPKRRQLQQAFRDISINEELFESLGPAINSGAGLFLYGEPGNGKSTLAQCVTKCFGNEIWIPQTLSEDGQLIKLYDAAYHQRAEQDEDTLLSAANHDRRWVKIRRPTVVVGGELTMDSLEIRHDPHSNVCEAPLQLKSNCGCLLVDDFGRQRIEPQELLNRWIVPLESRIDFLKLPSGKKIQVPFEQLIIFSTNLEPSALVDEAFLRRIPYKIEIADPSPEEFHNLFQLCCERFNCDYRPEVINYLLKEHFFEARRRLRRCHPRDLLNQIKAFCTYNELPMEMRPEYFDRAVKSYFTMVLKPATSPSAKTPTVRPAAGVIPAPAVGSAAPVKVTLPSRHAPVAPLAAAAVPVSPPTHPQQ